MVMYKQNQGLRASGTIGPQSTGPMMAPKKKPQYSVQSVGGSATLPGRPTGYLERVGYDIADLFTGGQYGRDRAMEYQQQQQKAPPMPSAPMMAPKDTRQFSSERFIPLAREMANRGTPLTGRETYGELENLYNQNIPRRVSAASIANALGGIDNLVRQNDAMAAAQQPETVTGDYRMPIKDPYEDLLNPYGDDYRTGLMSRASGEVARQFAPQREQLAANLAARGISPDSPLFQSIMAQQTQSEAASRASGIASAEREGLQSWANFELQKRAGKAGYINQLQAAGERLARQPAEIGSLQAKAQADIANAALASMNAETRLKFSQELEKSIENEFLMQGYKTDQAKIEANAAARLFEQTDPDQWYNQPWWPIVGKVAAGLVGAGVGFLIGGPPMAAYGGAIGAGIFPAGVPAPQGWGSSGMMSKPATQPAGGGFAQ